MQPACGIVDNGINVSDDTAWDRCSFRWSPPPSYCLCDDPAAGGRRRNQHGCVQSHLSGQGITANPKNGGTLERRPVWPIIARRERRSFMIDVLMSRLGRGGADSHLKTNIMTDEAYEGNRFAPSKKRLGVQFRAVAKSIAKLANRVLGLRR